MSARYDMSLEVNAKHFVEKLKNYQHSVDYFTVTGTHGTIATCLNPLIFCGHFIEKFCNQISDLKSAKKKTLMADAIIAPLLLYSNIEQSMVIVHTMMFEHVTIG
ncbi:unnamed protein product [Rotaria sordida]|uniref:Uncharacterized protein n=1 Tax=Rotaria sordida TaxID=392033 RepID=A0A815QL32_9BILA|nr:unnamed protein product [Rotaria sordida]CAF1463502.1 unnamed protein product [Rotaria sordida]